MTRQPPLFGVAQTQETSDDYYTPAWVFETMGLTFDLDVCAPPSGIPWIPATRYYSKEDDGLSSPWSGRVWMNPPYSGASLWVDRFIEHGNGVCLLPFSKSGWFQRLWACADAVCSPDRAGTWKFASERSIQFPVFFAAFGDECADAISRVGVVRRVA